jgi:hypothetical protein
VQFRLLVTLLLQYAFVRTPSYNWQFITQQLHKRKSSITYKRFYYKAANQTPPSDYFDNKTSSGGSRVSKAVLGI